MVIFLLAAVISPHGTFFFAQECSWSFQPVLNVIFSVLIRTQPLRCGLPETFKAVTGNQFTDSHFKEKKCFWVFLKAVMGATSSKMFDPPMNKLYLLLRSHKC